jgi:hypothetical protein
LFDNEITTKLGIFLKAIAGRKEVDTIIRYVLVSSSFQLFSCLALYLIVLNIYETNWIFFSFGEGLSGNCGGFWGFLGIFWVDYFWTIHQMTFQILQQ